MTKIISFLLLVILIFGVSCKPSESLINTVILPTQAANPTNTPKPIETQEPIITDTAIALPTNTPTRTSTPTITLTPIEVKAFPGAEGFGADTPGGRGGQVYEVTNLNDLGAGSFRACAEASGPRICVFRVAGTITLNSNIDITSPYITIADKLHPEVELP